MVVIQRVISAEIFRYIKKNLQTNDEWNADQIADFFSELMQRSPDLINVSAAFDGEDCVAFIVSLATTPGPMVFIAQAWAAPGLPEEITSKGFAWAVAWTKAIGRKYLKIETFRGAAMARKWGFTPHSEILKFDIPEGLLPGSLITKEEVSDGRRSTTTHDDADVSAGERSGTVGEEDINGVELIRSEAIQQSEGGSAGTSVEHGAESPEL